MSSAEKSFTRFRLRWFLGGTAVLLGLAALLWWSATRESPLDREITRRLAELRAAGEPVDSVGMHKHFPNPASNHDAGLLLTNVLLFAQNNPPPADTPIIISSSPQPRTEAFPELAMTKLRAYRITTSDIWKEWPSRWPTGAIFASHWELGMTNSSFPKYYQVRPLSQMMAALAMTAAEDGDTSTTTKMLERGFQFSTTLPSDFLVSHMIGRSIANQNLTAAERCLNRVQFSDPQLRHLSSTTILVSANRFADALRGEHCLAIWAFQALKAGGNPKQILSHTVGAKWWIQIWEDFQLRMNAYRDEDFLRYLELYQPSLKACQLPAAQAIPGVKRLMHSYQTNVTSHAGQGVPAAWATALQTDFEIGAKMTVFVTVLAIERFRLAHAGKIPAGLPELVPDFLPAVPRDLFDGQPLRFKTLPRGYVIYSVGADGVDDGGLEKTNNAARYDVTITVER
jgi:hypothetical protein